MVDHSRSNKRKKHHDKDKYYRLAKEQGLRSRAAFKLSQIQRQYPMLNDTNVILDLCAAPGGWTQIASRESGPNTHIIAVDIVPIRKIATTKQSQTITTIVGDITTDKCKADISRAIPKMDDLMMNNNKKYNQKKNKKKNQTTMVDVVLHDGAPNIGASYEKDAYEQMELSVHALRCATQHLKPGGTFVTKIYRSRDSTSFHWVVQQLFEHVQTFKPKASRPQSAEIFYICQNYYAPQKLDPKLLDPKYIFEAVEGDTTGGGNGIPSTMDDGGSGNGSGGTSKFHVFHKNWDKANKKHRDGYNTEHLDAHLRHVEPLSNFVMTSNNMNAIQLLSTCNGFSFHCDQCQDTGTNNNNNNKKNSCHCQLLLHHPLTTPEIKECVVDLKVLNKSDFKGLMIWREKMLQVMEHQMKDDNDHDHDDSDDEKEHVVDENKKTKEDTGDDGEEDEDQVQTEIQALRERKLREKKKAQKKERKLASKKRRQKALGMDLNAIEVQEDDQYFSLNTLKSNQDLNQVAEVNIDQATDEQVFGNDDSDDNNDDADLDEENNDKDEAAVRASRLEDNLDAAYERYLETTKNGAAKVGTKAAKRSKKLMREKLAEESHEDQELLLSNKAGMGQDAKTYVELLQGPKDSDDDDEDSSDDKNDDEDDDGFHAEPITPQQHNKNESHHRPTKRQKTAKDEDKNPLIHKFAEEPTSVKTARWFSNPLFASIGQAAESAQVQESQSLDDRKDSMIMDDEQDDAMDADDEETPTKGRRRGLSNHKKTKTTADKEKNDQQDGIDADDVLALMPKTDKQKRHEKRLKAKERDERRQARKAKKLGEAEGEFALAPAENDGDDQDEQELEQQLQGMSEEKKQKLLEARKLIKAGMGSGMAEDANDSKKFEVVETERPLPVMDDRKFDSDNEEYDSDDYAKTMALGTMMLRKSKAKALVDASYNRYAWNDPEDLPEWFVDDENRHYRPQLPIPPALLQKMKDKVAALSTRPIAKVAEARARKNRKAKLKLAAAKKKAQAVAGSSEMSESMKLKQISKALRSADDKKGGKDYVVAKKGKKGVKGSVMVDKRMKNDKRAMERSQKKRKNGKKGGLTGSKRRRHHS